LIKLNNRDWWILWLSRWKMAHQNTFYFLSKVSFCACKRTIHNSLGGECFGQQVQGRTPYHSGVNCEKQFDFTHYMHSLDKENLHKISSTDESFMQCLGKWSTYIQILI
jgi:hypothetical protein